MKKEVTDEQKSGACSHERKKCIRSVYAIHTHMYTFSTIGMLSSTKIVLNLSQRDANEECAVTQYDVI